ncbi:hypothetical protein Hanom_Chr08g00731341 [Helianthus anomalus]
MTKIRGILVICCLKSYKLIKKSQSLNFSKTHFPSYQKVILKSTFQFAKHYKLLIGFLISQ